MEQKSRKFERKLSNGLKFCLGIFFIYVIVAIFNIRIASEVAIDFFQMFVRIIPILGIVFIVMVVVNLFFTPEKTKKYLGRESGMKGWIYAIVSGILVSGPPYMLYPLLGELKKRGMTNSLLAVFLFNRNVKIPFIPAMIFYFGLKLTIILSVYIIIFSIMNGKVVEALTKETE